MRNTHVGLIVNPASQGLVHREVPYLLGRVTDKCEFVWNTRGRIGYHPGKIRREAERLQHVRRSGHECLSELREEGLPVKLRARKPAEDPYRVRGRGKRRGHDQSSNAS